ncbi:MAG: hypothetical protein AAFQ07_08410 [Chloroflexota bacterium]
MQQRQCLILEISADAPLQTRQALRHVQADAPALSARLSTEGIQLDTLFVDSAMAWEYLVFYTRMAIVDIPKLPVSHPDHPVCKAVMGWLQEAGFSLDVIEPMLITVTDTPATESSHYSTYTKEIS